MTKNAEDEYVRNEARADAANEFDADYMVRLHCDADAGSGIASYAPNQEGVSGGVHGPSQDVIGSSQTMGRIFHETMVTSLHHALVDRGFHPDTMTAVGAKQGALTGSIYSRVPVVLVEICVLTNPQDEQFILQPKNQELVSTSIAAGIEAALGARDR